MDDKEKLEQLKEGVLKPDEKLQKFDNHGITEDYLLDKLKEELEADEEVQCRISKKEVKTIKVPLWKIRQDARKDAHKLKGDYPAEKHEHTGDVIFHSNVPEPDMPEEKSDTTETEKEELFDVTDTEPMDTGTDAHTSPVKEEPTPNHDQDKEFKDHHRSRRESGK